MIVDILLLGAALFVGVMVTAAAIVYGVQYLDKLFDWADRSVVGRLVLFGSMFVGCVGVAAILFWAGD